MPDGRRAVSASHDKTVRLWDMENDQEIATFTGEAPMQTCAVSSDGQTIVVIETSGQAHFLGPVESVLFIMRYRQSPVWRRHVQ
jgi:WD40 repeat protein